MSTTVSARVPDAVFIQGAQLLQELGSSPTELVRAAYDYLIQERALPVPQVRAGEERHLGEAEARRLRSALDACRLGRGPVSGGDVSLDKVAARNARIGRYEALA